MVSVKNTLRLSALIAVCAIGATYALALNRAVREAGAPTIRENHIVLSPDSRVSFRPNAGAAIRNARLHVAFDAPTAAVSSIPLASRAAECFCAFKVHLGRLVLELSDISAKLLVLDRDHRGVERVAAEHNARLTLAGATHLLDITILDHAVTVALDGDTILRDVSTVHDFDRFSFAAFGSSFILRSVSLEPLTRQTLVIDTARRELLLNATWQGARFNNGSGLHNHHFIVWEHGRAGADALIVTEAADSAVHDALLRIGAQPGNNLSPGAWNRRRDPRAPEPDVLAEGDSLEIDIYFGDRYYSAREILIDRSGTEYDFRFAGNRAYIPLWRSGCVACLQSCPGSKIANRSYAMRDLLRGTALFTPAATVPFVNGDPVSVRIRVRH